MTLAASLARDFETWYMLIRMRLIPFLIAGLCSAQTLLINAGGPASAMYLADQGFSGGFAYGPASQADPGWKAQAGIYATLRYGAAFSYDFVVPNGSCTVKLDLIENRPAVSALGVPAAATGARVFAVAINGVSSGPIDIFAAAGAQTPYSPAPVKVPITTGHLHLDFKASVGNASISGIEASCTGPIISLMKCTKPSVASSSITNPDGTITKTLGSDCSGMYFVDLLSPSGTELVLLAMPAPMPLDPTIFAPVP
jgi:hypothetical protein